ncbi:MAG TPA: MerR family transcriptional regulator [Ornithinibacter sp.]|jgi:DNA-binding transcriptional MerR regulator|uniref:MerR family transcriptional regulator n=1 Tax=Ornithinibacter sp. TaxID=2862748 RepID=UPI002B558864|nr:MerR family transcriptional regulator [Ornithinibacter sp.]HOB80559.1 MerR family transcriptional regulator [Ornithinibacter sp.]HQD67179.1 MerR family transcriptional regulator [Ornithinibacter sp.]HQV81871.1 MerR family transcriptional regulator [Ornithinibacter sp.]HQW73807.1 MerR family transcriptional regulator [Ornithinibacter sp.]HQX87048.1 MerR family transcriptional regulator [Ornithinibacter sp.]
MTATSQHTASVDLTVGQVSQTFGVTVRTLHHYDAQGLVVPSARTHAGYRLYTDADLARLATVVTYRRLGLPLTEVRDLLDGQGTASEHLRRQREVVLTRLGELTDLVSAIDAALEAEMNDRPATTEELKGLFGDGFSEDHQAEAEQRWGETTAWKQSASRTKRYTPADWEQVKAEMDAVNAAFVAALTSGAAPDSDEAMAVAEAHREHIAQRFYDLDHTFHRGLADMYVADPRFTKTYEDLAPRLAQYVHDAIHANADRHDVG